MFITIQFPFVDYRYLQDNPVKLDKPRWPDPDPGKGNMIYFGRIFNRSVPYKGPWDDQKRYCNAKGVMNFCGMGDDHFYKSLMTKWDARILFRRFQSDGKFMAKFEIGFYDDFEIKINNEKNGGGSVYQLLYDHINDYLLCSLKVKIGSRYTDFVPLVHSGDHLADAYFWSTFKKQGKRSFDKMMNADQVSKCDPSILIQLDSTLMDTSSFDSQLIDTPDLNRQEIHLYYDQVRHDYQDNVNYYKTWFLAAPGWKNTVPVLDDDYTTFDETIRYLRINLLRIHVEKVVLKKILEKIGRLDEGYQMENPNTEKRVLIHLHKILWNLSKDSRNKQPQRYLVETAFMLEELIQEENLEYQLEGLKQLIGWLEKLSERNKQLITISKQIINNMGDQITIGTIHGNFVNKSHLVNSLNSSVNNGLDEETKQLLLEIAKKIEESQNIAAASLFNSFNEELAKPKPEQNKSKLRQFWDGLVKVLPDIANIGKSVAGIVALF